jgi:hypothetical protein
MNWIWRSCSSPHGPRNRLPPIFTPNTKERINPTADGKGSGIDLADAKARRSTVIGEEVHAGKAGRTATGVPNRDDVATGLQVGNKDPRAVPGDGGGPDGETVRVAGARAANAGHRLRRCPM